MKRLIPEYLRRAGRRKGPSHQRLFEPETPETTETDAAAPTQDVWRHFDPSAPRFAALIAKLDELVQRT